jgi:hypothetical protein
MVKNANKTSATTALTTTVAAIETLTGGQASDVIVTNTGAGPTAAATIAAREAQNSDNGSNSTEGSNQVASSEASGPASETNTPERATAIGEAGNAASLADGELLIGAGLGARDGDRLPISFEEALAKFTTEYPKLFALCEAAKDQERIVSEVRITAMVDGRRRGGIRHVAGVADYPVDAFTPQQLEQLLSDADFTIELI